MITPRQGLIVLGCAAVLAACLAGCREPKRFTPAERETAYQDAIRKVQNDPTKSAEKKELDLRILKAVHDGAKNGVPAAK